jgi:hypothetical protein
MSFCLLLDIGEHMGIFTKPKSYLSPDIFDSRQIMLPHVRAAILDWVYSIIPQNEVAYIFMIGSTTGYKWEPDSDIDLNVILTPESKGNEYWHPASKKVNGKLLYSTRHPMNIMPQDYHEPKWEEADFESYNIIDNTWAKAPGSPDDLPNPFEDNKVDLLFANMREEQIQTALSMVIKSFNKWKETKDKVWYDNTLLYLKDLSDIFYQLDDDRKLVYKMGWGVPRYSAENIIFKYIEKKKYLHILEEIFHFLKNSDGTEN